jgi:hypothetical protein
MDALEILKYLVSIETIIVKCGDTRKNHSLNNCNNKFINNCALNAALITDESRLNDKPTIFDALEILKYLVKVDGELLYYYGMWGM